MLHHHVYLTVTRWDPGVCLPPRALLLLSRTWDSVLHTHKPAPAHCPTPKKTGSFDKCVTVRTHLSQIYIPLQAD